MQVNNPAQFALVSQRYMRSTQRSRSAYPSLAIKFKFSVLQFMTAILVMLLVLACVRLKLAGSFVNIVKNQYAALSGSRLKDTQYDQGRIAQLMKQHSFIKEKIQKINKSADADMLSRLIVREAYKSKMDPFFLASVITSESSFKNGAVSHRGARGLMQLMPTTAQYVANKNDISWHGQQALHDPAYNISLGVKYLKRLKSTFNQDLVHTLVAYNWGPGNVIKSKRSSKKMLGESKQYASKILARAGTWKKEFEKMNA